MVKPKAKKTPAAPATRRKKTTAKRTVRNPAHSKVKNISPEEWQSVRAMLKRGVTPKEIESKYDIPATRIYAKKRLWMLEDYRKDPKYAKYHTPAYNAWRTAVFTRDNYTCRHCGKSKAKYPRMTLQADHIKPQSTHPELKFTVSNGRTLCVRCHKKTPTYGRKALNYKKKE